MRSSYCYRDKLMLRVLACCAGIAMLSGCGVTLESGKWRPLKADEARYTSNLKYLNFSEGYCNTMTSNEERDKCLAAYVEPRRYRSELDKEKSLSIGTAASSSPLGLVATVTVDDAKLYSTSDLDTDEIKPAILTDLSIHF